MDSNERMYTEREVIEIANAYATIREIANSPILISSMKKGSGRELYGEINKIPERLRRHLPEVSKLESDLNREARGEEAISM